MNSTTTLQYWDEECLDLSFAGKVTPEVEKLYSCLHCGACTASCPTANRMDASPQLLMRLVRLGLKEEVLASRAIWLCTSCQACSTHCPRDIPILETLIGLKNHSIRHNLEVPEDVRLLKQTIETTYNVSGDPNDERLGWSSNLPQILPELDRDADAEVLYFVGCVASFYPRAFSVPQAFGRILAHAGICFTTLGGEEWCCGYPLYNAGLKDEMGKLVEHNLKRVEETGIKRIVTTCPSCYFAWKVLFPRFRRLPKGLSILHASELLAELLEDGRLDPAPIERVVTYHDPCDLGRKSGQYDAPRRVLELLPGVELREMANIRDSALCCGGGGDVKIFSHDTTMDVARRRADQALDVEADTIVSGCQQCKRALMGAVQAMRQPIKVMDVTELVWESLRDEVEW